MFSYSGFTDKGLKREHNEDSFIISDNIYIVSDGMGGHQCGDKASEIIIQRLKNDLENYNKTLEESDITLTTFQEKQRVSKFLNNSILMSKYEIDNYALANNIDNIMGATVVGVYSNDILTNKIAVFHIGDSRVYQIRDNNIKQLTVDHSKYQELKDSGTIEEEILESVKKNIITKAIGNFTINKPDINFFNVKENDMFIICSDGINDYCSDDDILEIVTQNADDLDIIAQKIKDKVYENGAGDNLTLIILKKGKN
jgi:protein phosphatase